MKSSTRLIRELSQKEFNTSHRMDFKNTHDDHLPSHPILLAGNLYEIKLTDDALEKHIAYYANASGVIDMQSIYTTARNKMHLSEEKSVELATDIMKRAWYCNLPGVYYSLLNGVYGSFTITEAFPVFLLGYDGGLYQDNGAFREDLFEILQKNYAIENWEGQKVISKAKMKEFIEKETTQPHRFNNASWSYQRFAYNDIEFNTFFDRVATSLDFDHPPGQSPEKYVNLLTLKSWYIHPNALLDVMIKETPPLAEPTVSQAVYETLSAIL